MRAPIYVVAAFAVLSSSAAFADSVEVPFHGRIEAACEIVVGDSGVLAPSADYTMLGSEEAGGKRGMAEITVTGSIYSVTTDAPFSFSDSPPTGNDDVDFTTQYNLSGATNTADVPGATPTALEIGVSQVNVGLTAEKSSGLFAAGDYQADVSVTCE